jgi:hypothetical protein
VNLGTFTGPGSINWAQAAGKIAYIDVSVEVESKTLPASVYTVNGTYDEGAFNTETFFDRPNPTATIFLPPDITNATAAGVLGVILGWQGISAGNAQGSTTPSPSRTRLHLPAVKPVPTRARLRGAYRLYGNGRRRYPRQSEDRRSGGAGHSSPRSGNRAGYDQYGMGYSTRRQFRQTQR